MNKTSENVWLERPWLCFGVITMIVASLLALWLGPQIGLYLKDKVVSNTSAVDDAAINAATLNVEVKCDGWTDDNIELGVFVDANGESGELSSQLSFAGSGVQPIYDNARVFRAVAQTPTLMLGDGTVVTCVDDVLGWSDVDGSGAGTITLIYEKVNINDFTDNDLEMIANDSFKDQTVSQTVLSKSIALRDSMKVVDAQ